MQLTKFLNPKNDYAFKRIFGSQMIEKLAYFFKHAEDTYELERHELMQKLLKLGLSKEIIAETLNIELQDLVAIIVIMQEL